MSDHVGMSAGIGLYVALSSCKRFDVSRRAFDGTCFSLEPRAYIASTVFYDVGISAQIATRTFAFTVSDHVCMSAGIRLYVALQVVRGLMYLV